MNWQEICADPTLQGLPFKIELNQEGEIIMNAVQVNHSRYAWKIQQFLEKLLPGGECLPEFPVETNDNVKSPDVVWISDTLVNQVKDQPYSPVAPEICVEVKSPENTWKKMGQKAQLYFERGAHEVWVCDEAGTMHFYHAAGEWEKSKMVPHFPKQIVL